MAQYSAEKAITGTEHRVERPEQEHTLVHSIIKGIDYPRQVNCEEEWVMQGVVSNHQTCWLLLLPSRCVTSSRWLAMQ